MMLVLYGPTATGKTALAIKLAKKFNGEIISADSRQVYKGLDIGTGKVQPDDEVTKGKGFWIVNGIKVYGFDLINPGAYFSAGDFLTFASAALFRISAAKKLPIIVGGTGFYIKALTGGFDSLGIGKDQKLRDQLEKLSASGLYQRLKTVDHKRADSMNQSDRQNPRRLIRAIEIAALSRQSASTHYPLQTTNYHLVCLTAPNDYLLGRVDKWLDKRIKLGMIEEVQNLLNKKVDPKWLENLGLEYRWLTRYLLGQIKKEEAVERLRGDIHSLVRRQKTWLNKFKNRRTFDISQKGWQDKLEKSLKLWYNRTKYGK